jgi:hypothetical protein
LKAGIKRGVGAGKGRKITIATPKRHAFRNWRIKEKYD